MPRDKNMPGLRMIWGNLCINGHMDAIWQHSASGPRFRASGLMTGGGTPGGLSGRTTDGRRYSKTLEDKANISAAL